MHELSIAGNIVEAVQQEMTSRGISRVATIALKIGRMTDIDAEALRFGFDVITRETSLDGTHLIIEHIPIAARCKGCGSEFEVDEYLFICPGCKSSAVELIHGLELDIAYLEIPEDTDDQFTAQPDRNIESDSTV
jgi:hydrogenase nickel incorporation protein HypA/HybF